MGMFYLTQKKTFMEEKKKDSTTIGKHNKNAPDNMLSTIKRFIFRTIREIINILTF